MARQNAIGNVLAARLRDAKTHSEGIKIIRKQLKGSARRAAERQWTDNWNRRKSMGGNGG